MHRTTLSILLILFVSSTAAAAGRHRIVSLPVVAEATLSGEVRDLTTSGAVVEVAVEGPRRFARSDDSGKFTMQLPVGLPVTLSFSRTGYETLTETITIAGNTSRTFHLRSLPTATITDTSGRSSVVDSDTVEFGWAIPFLGYRRDRMAEMCRAGGVKFTLDRSEIDRIEGPAVVTTDAACCTQGPLTGAVFELATGERVTAYFLDSCDGAIMEVIARDHVTYQLVFVPFSQLREVVFP
ncbi:MAG TPA: carboxypeptidase-like regulatory domain-containing protein [Thermoanaerobaculia bacterium]|nr:carboxypeptidase-like regulatory domain-containing protein [Thermoanaerobaculia bacterium]